MRLDDGAGNSEPHAHALFSCGEERLEYLVDLLVVESLAVVGYDDAYPPGAIIRGLDRDRTDFRYGMDRVQEEIVAPTIDGLESDGLGYIGFLYFGLMLTADGPKVIVYELRQGVFVETARHTGGAKAQLDVGPAKITIDAGELLA